MLLPRQRERSELERIGFAGLSKLKDQASRSPTPKRLAGRSDRNHEGLCERGFSPVIGHSGASFGRSAASGPNSTRLVHHLVWRARCRKNVAALDTNNIHIGYLMEHLRRACRMSRQDRRRVRARRLGERGAICRGFRLGAKATKPDIEVKVIYIRNGRCRAVEGSRAVADLGGGGADFVYGSSTPRRWD